ncbi:hypothetical protein BESB_019700 [Besnoitia besnoiti]|uniref:Uncharacterized protein n=1 Tax=Besnoitia besnoiti TaxID=94643 RepID=A0A2A9M240_BESBE|nr:hypothetical protein BESB_019700 [Besnoitia besnoiti]PFH32029.1 hypothetical protein BESB_019700 [Besnoitia besnoiti]
MYQDLEQCARVAGSRWEAECDGARRRALQSAADVMTRECGIYEDAFFQCYRHGFRLQGCEGEKSTTQLLRCQKTVADRVLRL